MSSSRLMETRRLADLATALDEQSIQLDQSSHFIEIRKGGDGEVVVRANREGLIHLARNCLSLATQPSVGSHLHFDETGLVDHCDMPLILVLVEAEWERPGKT